MNVTPMIDVVMCLIVFYLMVGQLAMARRAAVDLPDAASGEALVSETDAIVVGVARDGSLTLGGDPIEPERLAGSLRGRLWREPGASVRVRADERATMRALRAALRAIEDAGARAIELATEREGGL